MNFYLSLANVLRNKGVILMPGSAKVTTDRKIIRHWAEKRGGEPATVIGTTGKKDAIGVLRINFPGYGQEKSLKEISWDDFFKKFDAKKLGFLYQDKLANGKESRFFKFVRRS